MELSVCSFASGSSGNCYLIQSSQEAILIDAGISTKKITAFLLEAGVSSAEISGVFVTHEHSDHTKGLKVLTKKNPEWQVYASEGTGSAIRELIHSKEQLVCFEAGEEMVLKDMEIQSIRISHDAADPVAYSIRSGGTRLTLLTDSGVITPEASEYLIKSDIIILEANHEVNMLKAGPYPYSLKRRILGETGHLSNEDAGRVLAETMQSDSRYRRIFLAHLSSKNNFPGLARQTVKNILEESGFYMDRDFSLEVMHREGLSGTLTVQ